MVILVGRAILNVVPGMVYLIPRRWLQALYPVSDKHFRSALLDTLRGLCGSCIPSEWIGYDRISTACTEDQAKKTARIRNALYCFVDYRVALLLSINVVLDCWLVIEPFLFLSFSFLKLMIMLFLCVYEMPWMVVATRMWRQRGVFAAIVVWLSWCVRKILIYLPGCTVFVFGEHFLRCWKFEHSDWRVEARRQIGSGI